MQESRDRVRSARSTTVSISARRVTVNLAPADLPKQGSRFDLAIAVGILVASGQLPPQAADGYELVGELSLAAVRKITGILPLALASREQRSRLIMPADNLEEAGLVEELTMYAVDHLLAVTGTWVAASDCPKPAHRTPGLVPVAQPDLADVCGQAHARRALEVAAAGRHNLLMMGPPGSGKSMLASRLPGILPPLSEDEALHSAAIRSVANHPFGDWDWRQRPFRPHHTASGAALVGGGSLPRAGEISLAHNGVLFLDELPEFDNRVLEVLREPWKPDGY